jgi:hypothetical protein
MRKNMRNVLANVNRMQPARIRLVVLKMPKQNRRLQAGGFKENRSAGQYGQALSSV